MFRLLLTWILCGGSALFAADGYRASILHYLENPADADGTDPAEYFPDGMLVVEEGRIVAVGDAEQILAAHDLQRVHSYQNSLIIPGFIDTHIHFPQTDMIAAYGEQLLEWLDTYTFPREKRFEDPLYASKIAEAFLDELLRNGTTTALAFGPGDMQAVEKLFEAARTRNMRMIAGQALGDRNLPRHLEHAIQRDERECRRMIERWHGVGRLLYAVTPRFAPTSSPAHLEMIGSLLNEFPSVYLHTHLSENLDETAWVASLFPKCKHYLDVYDSYNMVRPRSMFAHSIHLCEDEFKRLGETAAAVSFCPTSNLFLGSGLFDLKQAQEHDLLIGIGTDVGAGTTFSIPHTLGEGYKVAQLKGHKFDPFQAFYMATLGGARALALDHLIGNFEQGKEADFVVVDLHATPLLHMRMRDTEALRDKLFLLMILGDDRIVKETYIMGNRQYLRKMNSWHCCRASSGSRARCHQR